MDTGAWNGQRVAFTGRLATMSRAQAEALVVAAGGVVAPGVTARTTLLVVGMRGWPLMESGRVTRPLADAQRRRAEGGSIRIISEREMRERLGLDPDAGQPRKPLSLEQACRAVGVEPSTLERWEHLGLVRSSDGAYDFRDLVSLRTIAGLVARGVSPVLIRESLDELGEHLPGVDRPLSQLNILMGDSGGLVAEVGETLVGPGGQLELRFDARELEESGDAPVARLGAPRPRTDDEAERLIEVGLEFEESGDVARAEASYRQAIALAPSNAIAAFNLGNVLLARGDLPAAREQFARAASLEPAHARAWFNLAHVTECMGDRAASASHLRRAVTADPEFADAYYNLACALEKLGDRNAAASAWECYARLDPTSEWGAHARRRLGALRGPAWA